MPFIEHDLKTLLADMPHPFLQSEVKTIMMQLLSAVAHCHANWIVCLAVNICPTESYELTGAVAQGSQDVKSANDQSGSNQSSRLWSSSKIR